jgi:hypothetical protein
MLLVRGDRSKTCCCIIATIVNDRLIRFTGTHWVAITARIVVSLPQRNRSRHYEYHLQGCVHREYHESHCQRTEEVSAVDIAPAL